MFKLKEDILNTLKFEILSKIIYSDEKQAIRFRFHLASNLESAPDERQNIRMKKAEKL